MVYPRLAGTNPGATSSNSVWLSVGIGLLTAFGGLIAGIAASIWQGWVLHYLWAWFVVPAFGLPVLGLVAAMGISLSARFVIGLWSLQIPGDATKSSTYKLWTAIATSFFSPALFLLSGYVIKQFL